MTCRGVQKRMTTGGETQWMRSSDARHVSKCVRCSTYLRRDAAVVRLLALKQAPPPSPSLEADILRALREEEVRPWEKPSMAAGPGIGVLWAWRSAAAMAVLLVGWAGFAAYQRTAALGSERRGPPERAAEIVRTSSGRQPAPGLAVEAPDLEGPPAMPWMVFVPAAGPMNTPPDPSENRPPRPQFIRYEP